MAEPAGVFLSVQIEEISLKKVLNHTFPGGVLGKKVGYYFSQLLYDCIATPANVFLLHYDKTSNTCFIAWLLNHFEDPLVVPFYEVLRVLNVYRIKESKDYAIVASAFPEIYKAYTLDSKEVLQVSPAQVPITVVDKLMATFWSFSKKNSFPEPQKALRKRNYFYKNFKNYYKRYLAFIEEVEKPAKIANATKANPFKLFGNFFAYGPNVFEARWYTDQQIVLPNADPLSLRNVAGIIADNNHVYIPRLAEKSPPETVFINGMSRNNPNAVWEYFAAEGIDGKSFEYVKERWDTIYWKDKNGVYIKEKNVLKKIPHADAATFEYLDFCFGKDARHIFYYGEVILIDPHHYQLNKNGFIYDAKNIFHFEHQIPLDATSFKILSYESSVNPFMGTFILEDKNGTYEYNRKNENGQVRPV